MPLILHSAPFYNASYAFVLQRKFKEGSILSTSVKPSLSPTGSTSCSLQVKCSMCHADMVPVFTKDGKQKKNCGKCNDIKRLEGEVLPEGITKCVTCKSHMPIEIKADGSTRRNCRGCSALKKHDELVLKDKNNSVGDGALSLL